MDLFSLRILSSYLIKLQSQLKPTILNDDQPWIRHFLQRPDIGPGYTFLDHNLNVLGLIKARTIVNLMKDLLIKSLRITEEVNDKSVHKHVSFMLDDSKSDQSERMLQCNYLVSIFYTFGNFFLGDEYNGIVDHEKACEEYWADELALAFYCGVAHSDKNINKVIYDFTILTHFCKNGTAECIKFLIDRGADVNLREPRTNLTPLKLAARFGDYATVKLLLDAGADPCALEEDNVPSFSLAVRFSEEITLELILDKLIEQKPDADLTEGLRLLPWALAFIKNTPDQKDNLLTCSRWWKYTEGFLKYNQIGVERLIDFLISRRNIDNMYITALCYAAEKKDWQMVRRFLQVLVRKNLPELENIFDNAYAMIFDITHHHQVLFQFDVDFGRKLKRGSLSGSIAPTEPKMNIRQCVEIGLSHSFLSHIKHHIRELFEPDHRGVLLFYKVMKQPCFWKYIYPAGIKDGVFQKDGTEEILNKAYVFARWYSNVPRNDIAYFKMSGPSNPVHWNGQRKPSISNLMQKEYIAGVYTEDACKEEQQIKNYLLQLLKDISKQVAETHTDLAFNPLFTGSSAEHTKAGYPDDYDFLLIMQNQGVLQTCKFGCENNTLSFNAKKPDGTRYFIYELWDNLKDILREKFHCYNYPNQFSLTKNITMISSFVRPASLSLNWCGQFFLDLTINIDLTPAFKMPNSDQFLHLTHLPEPIYCIPKYMGSSEKDFRLTFSVDELQAIKTLPEHMKCGYQVAKAMRHREICPPMTLKNGRCVEAIDYISTYMLKTCFLFVAKDKESQKDYKWSRRYGIVQYESVTCAKQIYTTLKGFLKNRNGKIPHYFVQTASVSEYLQIGTKRGILEEQLAQEKTEIQLHYVNLALDMLNECLSTFQGKCL